MEVKDTVFDPVIGTDESRIRGSWKIKWGTFDGYVAFLENK